MNLADCSDANDLEQPALTGRKYYAKHALTRAPARRTSAIRPWRCFPGFTRSGEIAPHASCRTADSPRRTSEFDTDAALNGDVGFLDLHLRLGVVSARDTKFERERLRQWSGEIDVGIHAIVTGWTGDIGKDCDLLIRLGGTKYLARGESQDSANASVTGKPGGCFVGDTGSDLERDVVVRIARQRDGYAGILHGAALYPREWIMLVDCFRKERWTCSGGRIVWPQREIIAQCCRQIILRRRSFLTSELPLATERDLRPVCATRYGSGEAEAADVGVAAGQEICGAERPFPSNVSYVRGKGARGQRNRLSRMSQFFERHSAGRHRSRDCERGPDDRDGRHRNFRATRARAYRGREARCCRSIRRVQCSRGAAT